MTSVKRYKITMESTPTFEDGGWERLETWFRDNGIKEDLNAFVFREDESATVNLTLEHHTAFVNGDLEMRVLVDAIYDGITPEWMVEGEDLENEFECEYIVEVEGEGDVELKNWFARVGGDKKGELDDLYHKICTGSFFRRTRIEEVV